MDKKQRTIFRISLLLNAFLIALVVWGHLTFNYLKDQVSLSEVQYKLLKLETLIEKQGDNNWTEPNVVTTHLKDVIDNVWIAAKGETITQDDTVMLHNLHTRLRYYPYDTINSASDITEQDKRNFEELREVLYEVRQQFDQEATDYRAFLLNKSSELEKRMEKIKPE